MINTCKGCGKRFRTPTNVRYCSKTCEFLGPQDDRKYYPEDKKRIEAISKFVYYMFSKSEERKHRLINGGYNLWDIYTAYEFFVRKKYPGENLRIDDELLFVELFKEAVGKRYSKISLTTMAINSKEKLDEKARDQWFGFSVRESKYLPFGEDLYYVDKNSECYKSLYETTCDTDDITSELKENEFEKAFVGIVEDHGGVCWKLAASSPGCSGVPDRVVVLPGDKMGFVELKRPDQSQKPRPNQIEKLDEVKRSTKYVYVLDKPELIGKVIDDIQGDRYPEIRYK